MPVYINTNSSSGNLNFSNFKLILVFIAIIIIAFLIANSSYYNNQSPFHMNTNTNEKSNTINLMQTNQV